MGRSIGHCSILIIMLIVNAGGGHAGHWAHVWDWVKANQPLAAALFIGVLASMVSLFVGLLASVGVWYSSRHNERMLVRLEESERIRRQELWRKSGETLYRLVLKRTKDLEGGSYDKHRRSVGNFPEDVRGDVLREREKESEEAAADWDRMETLVRIYFPEWREHFYSLLAAITKTRVVQNVLYPSPEDVKLLERLRHQSLGSRRSLLLAIEQKLGSAQPPTES